MARLIQDAGGSYMFENNTQRESLPLNIEKVIETGTNASIWINIGNSDSRTDILKVDHRLSNLRPYNYGQVFNNTARMSLHGGNDFWESGTTHPQVLLKDLIKIFHPELLPNYELVYYKKLN